MEINMKILIITGGRIDEDFVLGFLNSQSFDQIISVDGALAFWDKVVGRLEKSVKLDHIVGDFDTLSPEILQKYIENGKAQIHSFNPIKDYTDTDIAVKLAIELAGGQGHDCDICLIGAIGSRMDHSLANIQLLKFISDAGMRGCILDPNNRISLASGEMELRRSELFGDFLSLIPVTMSLKGVSMEGFKYEVDGIDVRLGESRCVSNEVYQENCRIEIREGIALLIESRD